MNLKTASKSRVFLSTDRCSLPESKRSIYVDLVLIVSVTERN